MTNITIIQGDSYEALKTLEAKSVQMCVTSPPYFGLRDYGIEGQIGLEASPTQYIEKLVLLFGEVYRALKDDGTLWLNIGDSYAGSGKCPAGNLGKVNDERNMTHTNSSLQIPEGCKPKDLIGIPWMLAFALRADGWYLRSDIIWSKPNPMPESVKDRPTKSHEYLFLLSKSSKYLYNAKAIAEPCAESTPARMLRGVSSSHKNTNGAPGQTPHSMNRPRDNNTKDGNLETFTRNKRDVWTVNTKPYKGAHFATFPPALVEPCILAGSHLGDLVLDPFSGSGTTGMVAKALGRSYVGIDLNPEYNALAKARIG